LEEEGQSNPEIIPEEEGQDQSRNERPTK